MKYDKLIQYLIQCRADDFKVEFSNALKNGLKWDDVIICYPLYAYAAAIRELLTEDYNSDIFDFARKGNDKIWKILKAKGFIPADYQEKLIEFAKDWETYDENDSYEDVLDMSLPELEKQGARKIDCDLYIAAIAFNFEKAKELLEKGANPDAKLSIDYQKFDDGDTVEDYYNILSHCADYWCDVYQPCEYIMDTWLRGMKKEDEKIGDSMCFQVIISAAHKMMFDVLDKYSRDNDSINNVND